MPLVFKRIIFISYLVVIAIMAVFPFSVANVGAMNKVYVLSFRLDHLLHVMAFVPLYPLGTWLFQPVSWKGRVYLLFMGLLIAFAAEIVQLFIPFRAYNPADLISNLAGVVVGAIIYYVYSSLVAPRRN